jgi:hypothetical protein
MSPSQPTAVKSFLDTSVVYKLQVGTTAHKEHLSSTISKNWYVNNYVQMEFYRALLIQCVQVYFEADAAIYATFGDVFNGYAERFGREPKIAVNVLTNMQADGYSLGVPKDKEILRQKLQDFVFMMAQEFRDRFTDMGKDPSRCSRVPHPIRLPKDPSDRDAVLRKIAITFKDKEECRRRCNIDHLFESSTYGPKLEAIASTTTNNDALEKIRRAIRKAQEDPSCITCNLCGKMGDAIIATSLDSAWKLHSMDQVHSHISEAISLESEIHPSFAALRKQSNETA